MSIWNIFSCLGIQTGLLVFYYNEYKSEQMFRVQRNVVTLYSGSVRFSN